MERSREDLKKIARLIKDLGGLNGLASIFKSHGASNISSVPEEEIPLVYDKAVAWYGELELKKRPLQKFERWKYGLRWNAHCLVKKDKLGKPIRTPVRPRTDIEIEMQCFLRYEKKFFTPGGLGRYEHCKRGIEMIWHPGARKVCTFNPYAERMFEAFCSDHQFIAFAGHSSGGKTFNPAVWAVWNFLCAPTETLVILTSTSLQASRKRIWGDVQNLWNAAGEYFQGDLPGDLISSTGTIRAKVDGVKDEKAGIVLIAGDPSKAEESIGKLIGFKNKRVIFLCDEMPDLADNLTEAAKTNLRNNDWFQMVGIGNPSKLFDAFGKFCEPKAGWPSVSEKDYEWVGVHAYVLRFDAKNSPNVVAAENGDYSNPYPGLLKWQDYKAAKEEKAEESPGFYRMYRAWWCPTGSEESIYWESEIATYGANLAAGTRWHWLNPPSYTWGLDPSFKHGGDDAVFTISRVGEDSETRLKVIEKKETIVINVNVNDPLPKDEQVVKAAKEIIEKKSLGVSDGAVDVSGAASFGSLLRREIGDGWIAVEFGGKPSDMPASNTDPRPSHEIYNRMVAELWHVGKELIRNGQMRGLTADVIKEMINRTYETKAGKIQVQTKEDMKKMLGFSPDRADSFFLSLFAARKKFGLVSKEKSKENKKVQSVQSAWNTFQKKAAEASSFYGKTFHYGS